MYGRKASCAGIDPGAINLMTGAAGLPAAGPIGLDAGVDETLHGEGSEVIWSSRNGPRKFLRLLSLLRYHFITSNIFKPLFVFKWKICTNAMFIFSLCSVMLNTPKTFKEVPSLRYITYAVDIICLIFFIAEMITKIKHLGLIGTEKVTTNACDYNMNRLLVITASCSNNLNTNLICLVVLPRPLVNIWCNDDLLYPCFYFTANLRAMWAGE